MSTNLRLREYGPRDDLGRKFRDINPSLPVLDDGMLGDNVLICRDGCEDYIIHEGLPCYW